MTLPPGFTAPPSPDLAKSTRCCACEGVNARGPSSFQGNQMFAQFGARLAAVQSVVEKLYAMRFRTIGGLTAAAVTLGGCLPTTAPLAGADPADPSARVAAVGYRSTVAPYTTLRPVAPSPWREQNDRAAPAPKSGR
jgi:hypothetical protein